MFLLRGFLQNVLHNYDLHSFQPIFTALVSLDSYTFVLISTTASPVSHLYLTCGKKIIRYHIRAVRRMTHRFNVLTGQKFLCYSRCVRARITMLNNNPSLHYFFTRTNIQNSPKNVTVSMLSVISKTQTI